MDPYFPIILTQNLILCLVTICFVYRNSILKKAEKNAFYLSLAMGVTITVCEYISTSIVNNPRMIWLQYAANFLNLGLTPLLPAIPVLVLSRKNKYRIYVLIPVTVNLLLLLSGQLFTISPSGAYSRDPLFWTFMVNYLLTMLLLTFCSILFSHSHQNHNAISLLLISLFMISSTTIQLRHPQIHFSWFCVTVTCLLYYLYYTDVIEQMDSLTGLLNRNSFQNYSCRRRSHISGLVMIDLDDFKTINDTYGHLVGDRYLITFGENMRKVFQHWGYCYRLGGDEFCVLMDQNDSAPDLDVLLKALEKCCLREHKLPQRISFSWGYQALDADTDISCAIDQADRYMYARKSAKKVQK